MVARASLGDASLVKRLASPPRFALRLGKLLLPLFFCALGPGC